MTNSVLTGFWFLSHCLLVLTFSPFPAAVAADCSVVEYLREKSSMSEMLVNPCLNDNTAGVGAVFQLHPGGRLWLKTISSAKDSSHYQLICRNKSEKASKISVTGRGLPWIQAGGYVNCNNWVENKMVCKNSNGEADKLFCAIALMQMPETNQTMQRKTSVTMRGPKDDEKSNTPKITEAVQVEQLAEWMKPEINLCRIVYRNQQSLSVEWVIKASGRISRPKIYDATADADFTGCVLDVVKSFNYPILVNDLQVSIKF